MFERQGGGGGRNTVRGERGKEKCLRKSVRWKRRVGQRKCEKKEENDDLGDKEEKQMNK